MTLKQKRTVAGVKGFALCFILGYMAFSQVFLGGHLGYQFLFALFGYVAFDHYIKQKMLPGPFFVEKVKAYWPELLGMLAVTTLLFGIVFPSDLPLVRGQVLSAAFFANNIFQGIQGQPLSIHQPSPFGHLWFISLLMQCYFILSVGAVGKKTKQKIVSLTFFFGAISIISALLLGLYGGLHLAESRIFYMPDARLFSFFVAVPVVTYGVFSRRRTQIESREIAMLGIIILFVIFVLFMPEDNLAYFGGLLLSSVLLSLFLLFLMRGETSFESVFHFPLFTFLGDRAYSLYLYSMPVFYFVRQAADAIGLNASVATIIAFIVLLFVGQVSYYAFSMKNIVGRKAIVAMVAIVGLILAYSFMTQPAETMNSLKKKKQVVKTVETKTQKQEEKASITEKFQPSDELAVAIEQVNAQQPNYKLTNEDLGKLQSQEGLLLGDSGASAAREAYLKLMPNLRVHGDKNLTPDWYVERLKEYKGNGPIILQIGNDMKLEYNDVKTMIEAAEGRPTYIISVVTSPEFEDHNNDILYRIADSYANVSLVDWHKEAKTQTDFFDEDGNMKQPATRLMAHMLAHRMLYNQPTATGNVKEDQEDTKAKTKTEADLTLGEDDRATDIKESN